MEREPIWEKEDEEIGADREYWGEEEWERFMIQQDRKVDEMMRLADLFMNSGMKPHDLELEDEDECDDNCPECADRYSCWVHQEQLAKESREATGAPEPAVEDDDEADQVVNGFRKLPAYQESFEFGVAAFRWLHELSDAEFDRLPAMEKLARNCGIPGAKIAGGHGIGYRPDSICGNIVNCRRAETAMVASIEALRELVGCPERAEKARELLQQGEGGLRLIRERISILRAEARRLHGEGD